LSQQREIVLKVTRYHPEAGPEPYIQQYPVPVQEGMMVLDALNFVRDKLDPSLAFRWSCRMGICGSCGMMVDGSPKLTCETPLEYSGNGEVSIAPLEYFPVIRDLVVDISDFMEKLQRVQPWLIRDNHQITDEGEYLQTPEQRDQYIDHAACINCMLCYAACPVYGLNLDFIGPAALALARRYNLDSRDQGEKARQAILSQQEGVWDCLFVGECSVVCPKRVMPAEAIQRSKARLAKHWASSLFTSLWTPGSSTTEGL
jgi:fumarate reductase iron-sulfur subunit